MDRVAIWRCTGYDMDQVRAAVGEAVRALGGMAAFVEPGDRVLLKPNLLMRRAPDRATTTHPAVVQAVAELVVAAGGIPLIFDSPGGASAHTVPTMEGLYATCGMADAAAASGAQLVMDTQIVDVPYPQGRRMKAVKTIAAVTQVDKIINLPKLKTHMMMTLSGAVKNLFGIVPGHYKTEYHFRFEQEDDFAGMLLDLCAFAAPVLTVVDAIVAMEGSGPTNGTPRQLDLVLASADPYGLDVAAAECIGLNPRDVPTIRESVARGLCGWSCQPQDIVGCSIADVRTADFAKARNVALNIYDWWLPKPLARRVNRAMKYKPGFRLQQCKGCGVCAASCPAKAIDMVDKRPKVDLSRCISCFCCHELCRWDAVDICKPWLFRAIIK